MPRFAVPAVFALAAVLHAQTAFFPLKDVKPGMRGIGKTVFSGSRIDEFQVEILGVLENIGPKQNLILARLSGGPLAETGVLQGMSGSPVYIDGKLAGAVALAFPFAKEAITGIRPIEEMVRVTEAGRTPPQTQVARNTASSEASLASLFASKDLTRLLPSRSEPAIRDTKLLDISTPVSFAGFTRATLDAFAPQLRALGLEPTQGVSSGGPSSPHMGDPSVLKPGSMISVQLMTGDLSIGADGTVTYIDGNRIYAFGHRFLAVGSTALPFTRSEVLALLPVMSASFKISAPKETMGAILQDRNTAIAGELGRVAAMAPVSISVSRGGKRLDNYQMEMVNDRFLSPLLVQMAVYSTIDATERTVGASSFRVTGEIEFQGSAAPLKVNNMYAADTGSAMIASLSTSIPLAYVLQSGFDALEVKKVALDIESFDAKKQFEIDSVSVGRREVRPGEKVELTTMLVGENGAELVRKIEYRVPQGITPGPLYFTVADGMTTNLTEFRQIIGMQPKSISQLISTVNNLRANTKAYVRVWRAEPAFQLEGADLPDPPPSVAMILAGSQTAFGSIGQTRNSKVAELEIGAGDSVINGSKTIQVEVKE
ncbi:MAG TPA: SpoIVB peptidase S55 domain-containing protein [Bryobacteraceae bacterium]|nr:SpoIVB peptidase S55 domain-containing protein [Bryobacteraceae bacterium]